MNRIRLPQHTARAWKKLRFRLADTICGQLKLTWDRAVWIGKRTTFLKTQKCEFVNIVLKIVKCFILYKFDNKKSFVSRMYMRSSPDE